MHDCFKDDSTYSETSNALYIGVDKLSYQGSDIQKVDVDKKYYVKVSTCKRGIWTPNIDEIFFFLDKKNNKLKYTAAMISDKNMSSIYLKKNFLERKKYNKADTQTGNKVDTQKRIHALIQKLTKQ